MDKLVVTEEMVEAASLAYYKTEMRGEITDACIRRALSAAFALLEVPAKPIPIEERVEAAMNNDAITKITNDYRAKPAPCVVTMPQRWSPREEIAFRDDNGEWYSIKEMRAALTASGVGWKEKG